MIEELPFVDNVTQFGNNLGILFVQSKNHSMLIFGYSQEFILSSYQDEKDGYAWEYTEEVYKAIKSTKCPWQSELPGYVFSGEAANQLFYILRPILKLKELRKDMFDLLIDEPLPERLLTVVTFGDKIVASYMNKGAGVCTQVLSSKKQLTNSVNSDLFKDFPESRYAVADFIATEFPEESDIQPETLVGTIASLIASVSIWIGSKGLNFKKPIDPRAGNAHLN